MLVDNACVGHMLRSSKTKLVDEQPVFFSVAISLTNTLLCESELRPSCLTGDWAWIMKKN